MGLTGCDVDEGTGGDEPTIVGVYTDAFGGTHDITADAWTQTYEGSQPTVFHIESFDDDAGWIVAQNDAANEYNPEKYSRFDWTRTADERLFYCQHVFDAESVEAAMGAAAPDATDPQTTGCSEFAWTELLEG